MADDPTIVMGDNKGAVTARLPIPSQTQIKELELACRLRRLTKEERGKALEFLTYAVENAKSVRTRISATKALATFEATEARDVQHTERMEYESGIIHLKAQRAEEGKPNDCISLIVAPEKVLPPPDWLNRINGKN